MIECVSPLSAAPVQLIIEPGRAEKNYWRDLWRYRELFQVLAWRDVSGRYNYHILRKDTKTQEAGRRFTTPSIQQFYRMVRNDAVLWERSKQLKSMQVSV